MSTYFPRPAQIKFTLHFSQHANVVPAERAKDEQDALKAWLTICNGMKENWMHPKLDDGEKSHFDTHISDSVCAPGSSGGWALGAESLESFEVNGASNGHLSTNHAKAEYYFIFDI